MKQREWVEGCYGSFLLCRPDTERCQKCRVNKTCIAQAKSTLLEVRHNVDLSPYKALLADETHIAVPMTRQEQYALTTQQTGLSKHSEKLYFSLIKRGINADFIKHEMATNKNPLANDPTPVSLYLAFKLLLQYDVVPKKAITKLLMSLSQMNEKTARCSVTSVCNALEYMKVIKNERLTIKRLF